MLKAFHSEGLVEAGCDEAGRGCLAGPVYAAAVILPSGFSHPLLNDSKKLSVRTREILRYVIESEALSYAVAAADVEEIDQINILNASILAMHRAVEKLSHKPEFLLVDGNRFKPIGGNSARLHCQGRWHLCIHSCGLHTGQNLSRRAYGDLA